jgi:TonB family protein
VSYPIVIVGGGIAGLAAALGLRARGVECVVMESAREIVPLGVGINLLPHGVRVLVELGLQEELAAVSVETRAIEYRARDGRLISAQIQRSSGHPQLDAAALQVLRLASPFEPFPADIGAQHERLRFAYEWQFNGGQLAGGTLAVP